MAPLPYPVFLGISPGFLEPQKSQGTGGIICENPGPGVWKGLGRWQGPQPSLVG